MLNCCVIDDEPLAGQLLASYIERTSFTRLEGVFTSAQDAVKLILDGVVDLVFLDIQMPQINGIEFARIIPDTVRIVFTTAYDNYAIEGIKVNALDYLLKPIDYNEFLLAANKARTWKEKQAQSHTASTEELDRIIVKVGYRMQQIAVKDILFIEGLKDYVRIYIDGSDMSVMTLMSMKALERSLPASMFMRVHRSYIVNTSKISTIERNHLVFGKHNVPVSDSFRQQFFDYVARHTIAASTREDD